MTPTSIVKRFIWWPKRLPNMRKDNRKEWRWLWLWSCLILQEWLKFTTSSPGPSFTIQGWADKAWV